MIFFKLLLLKNILKINFKNLANKYIFIYYEKKYNYRGNIIKIKNIKVKALFKLS